MKKAIAGVVIVVICVILMWFIIHKKADDFVTKIKDKGHFNTAIGYKVSVYGGDKMKGGT